ncbi:MAG TPA: helix-turn-helix transcriptional regulator [Candidatus Tectomicrobia bacterium]
MAASQGGLSQDALRTILTQLPFGLMVLDLKGTVLTCNPAAQMILKNRFGWRGSEADGSRSLPREILAGVEYLCEASRHRAYRGTPSSLTLTSPDLYLHLWLLSLKEEPRLSGSKHLYVVVVLKSGELSLTVLWQSQARLTPREAEVLQRLAQGKTRKEISVILQVSEATVRTHLEHLYVKLGVANKVEAASIALWQQLAESLTSMMPGLSW